MEMLYLYSVSFVPPNTAAINHVWLLSTWNMASVSEELNDYFYFTFIKFNLFY